MAEFCSLFGIEQSIATHLMLPIGISFYIFSAIGYIIDIYRGDITETVPFYQEALYILFFPKILQGPLHKATDFIDQLKKEHPTTWSNISLGLQIFLFGLIKKIVIADRLGLFVDTVYAAPKAFSGLTLLLTALTYPIQLYCDFSGYSDMAVGTAKMMGYDLCPNFNLPFLSKNVAEYWRRWHMSLNIWFRDYLFYPVVRSNWVNELRKKTKAKSKKFSKIVPSIIGMTIVWPLVGLWHGSSWNFVLYGTCYGFLMIFGTIFSEYHEIQVSFILNTLRIVRTFIIAVILLISFRMPNLAEAKIVFSRIVTMEAGINYFYTWSLIFIPIVFALSIFAYMKNDGNGYYISLDLSKFRNKVIFCTVVLLTIIFMHVGENYFMYFQF